MPAGLTSQGLAWHGVQDMALVVVAALCSAALIVLLRPLFVRYALARPNARSSHTKPAPQGGGVAVVLAVIIVLAVVGGITPQGRAMLFDLLPLGAAVVILT